MWSRARGNYEKLFEDYTKFLERTGDRLILTSIRRGLILIIPIVLIGSFALLCTSFPLAQYQSFMLHVFGAEWKNFFTYVHDGTIRILSLSMVLCISYSLVNELAARDHVIVNPVIASCVSLCSFVALFGISKDNFAVTNYGVMGAFFAIVAAVFASLLFYKLSFIKAFQIRPFSDGDSVTFGHAVSTVIPAAITISIFAFINQLLSILFRINDINAFLSGVLCSIFTNVGSPLQALLFIFLIHFLWFFGIHGSNMLEHVAQSIFVPALAVNQQLIANNQPPTQIFTKTFFDTFVLMGGCGSTLCLIFAIFMVRKNKNQLRIAKFSFVPLLFNINELIVFGFPIVLNPIFVLPFVLVPLILTVTSFTAMSLGLVPYTCHLVEWTTPVFISGYYATGSVSGPLLQLFNLVLGTLCYIPFVRLSQTISASRMSKNFERLCKEFKRTEKSAKRYQLLERQDTIGILARALAEDLKHDIQTKSITLFYQPQVDYHGRIFCAEALLRWKHATYGYIYPPLVIDLAEKYHILDELTFLIIDKACSTMKKMNELGLEPMAISVNITASQLENEAFSNQLSNIIHSYQLSPDSIKLEITEQVALENNKKIRDQLVAIRDMGIELAMDDFGMGHSSLMYLKEYNFDIVKLDGSLVREICSNASCREIISSIVYLSRSLDYAVLAEYVENNEQMDILHDLGCDQYQGYLFSEPLPFEDLIEFIRRNQSSGSASMRSESCSQPDYIE